MKKIKIDWRGVGRKLLTTHIIETATFKILIVVFLLMFIQAFITGHTLRIERYDEYKCDKNGIEVRGDKGDREIEVIITTAGNHTVKIGDEDGKVIDNFTVDNNGDVGMDIFDGIETRFIRDVNFTLNHGTMTYLRVDDDVGMFDTDTENNIDIGGALCFPFLILERGYTLVITTVYQQLQEAR